MFSKLALNIIAPITYQPAYSIVILIIFSYIILGVNPLLQIGIGISKKTKYVSYAQAIVFFITVFCYLTLIPKFGAWGAGAALLIGSITQSICFVTFSNKVYKIEFPLISNFIFLLSIFSLGIIHVLMIEDINFTYNAISSFIAYCLVILYTWIFWLKKEDKEILLKYFRIQKFKELLS